jgi:hypothetical protein
MVSASPPLGAPVMARYPVFRVRHDDLTVSRPTNKKPNDPSSLSFTLISNSANPA